MLLGPLYQHKGRREHISCFCLTSYMRLSRILAALLFAFVGSMSDALGQYKQECGIEPVPLTTHPDRPVLRDTTRRYHDDWRNPEWVVSLSGETRADSINQILAPFADEITSVDAPHRIRPWMSPDDGWEILNSDQTKLVASGYRTKSAIFLFYNKYLGLFRPLIYFREGNGPGNTHYSFESSVRGNDGLATGVVYSPLDREAVDSNLTTNVVTRQWYKLTKPLPANPTTWLSAEFEAQYDPCACNLSDRLWFNLNLAKVIDTIIEEVPATITYGPYLFSGIASYIGGQDQSARSGHTDGWIPFYDAPFGTWTLLRTPRVISSLSSEQPSASNTGTVSMQLRTLDQLLYVVNAHVFQPRPQKPAQLFYVLCIRGGIENVEGLRRLNDTLWTTIAMSAEDATRELTTIRFTPKGAISFGPVRLAIMMSLTPRDPLSSINNVDITSVYATKTTLTDNQTTPSSTVGWRQATDGEIDSLCMAKQLVPYSRRRRRSALPSVDTLSSSSSPIEVNLHPNPASDQVAVDIHIGLNDRLRSIVIFDLQGRTYRIIELDSSAAQVHRHLIDVSGLSVGAYFMAVRSTISTTVQQLIVAR